MVRARGLWAEGTNLRVCTMILQFVVYFILFFACFQVRSSWTLNSRAMNSTPIFIKFWVFPLPFHLPLCYICNLFLFYFIREGGMNNFPKQCSKCLFTWIQSTIMKKKNTIFSDKFFFRKRVSSLFLCALWGGGVRRFPACDKRHFISTFKKTVFDSIKPDALIHGGVLLPSSFVFFPFFFF